MEQATGSADHPITTAENNPSRFWAVWEILQRSDIEEVTLFSRTSESDLPPEAPETKRPQEFDLSVESCFVILSSGNLAIHDLVHGSVKWDLDSYEHSQSTNEVVVKGEPVKRGSRHSAYCHCGKCDWIWFSQGWECWPGPTIEDID